MSSGCASDGSTDSLLEQDLHNLSLAVTQQALEQSLKKAKKIVVPRAFEKKKNIPHYYYTNYIISYTIKGSREKKEMKKRTLELHFM